MPPWKPEYNVILSTFVTFSPTKTHFILWFRLLKDKDKENIFIQRWLYYTYASGKTDKREMWRRGRKENCSKKTRLEIAMGQSRRSLLMSLKAFSTIFHNFPFKISVRSNYLLLKILKRIRTVMNEYSNK